ASQPHRHLQLLPRHTETPSCPIAAHLRAQLGSFNGSGDASPSRWPWAYRLSRRHDPIGGSDLEALYLAHAEQLGLGSPLNAPQPLHPYNLLFDDDWLLTVRRTREHCAGFSLNALAFGGYLLATEHSDLDWLIRKGPWQLLQAVASPKPFVP
ncbi:MAG: ATP adenylyltransferase, partial [Cyanobium sp.]